MNTYDISTDPTRLQPAAIHAYLTRSYWSPGIPKEVVERAIANSLCFGIYLGAAQVGF
ncbi:MAG: N-acetyltransferase, partial [Bradyrhizobium sp.]|nr:N-acetyltransferase [Bradyrhizobium sp.]